MNSEKQFRSRQIKILGFITVALGLLLFSFQNCTSGLRLMQNSATPSHAGERNDMFNEAIDTSINSMRQIESTTFNRKLKKGRKPDTEFRPAADSAADDAKVYLRFKSSDKKHSERIEVPK